MKETVSQRSSQISQFETEDSSDLTF